MVKEGQDIFVGAMLQDAAAGFDGELGIGIEGKMPVGVGELEGLVEEVDDMEQAIARGVDEQTGVPKGVAFEVDHGDAGAISSPGLAKLNLSRRDVKRSKLSWSCGASEADQRADHSSHSACVVM